MQKEIEEKDMKKLKNIKYKKLEIQPYLKSNNISLRKKKILFKARTRMLNVKGNFRDKSPCPLCYLEEDRQEHLMACLMIKLKCPIILENKNNCTYMDIFTNDIKKQSNVAELLLEAIRTREKILNKF